MKNKNLILLISLLTFSILLTFVVVCVEVLPKQYNAEWIIGKTADEIIERYGEFDRTMAKEYGIREGAYLTKAEGRLPLGDVDPAEYYVIYFNSDGYACAVEKNYVYTRDYIALDIPIR